jgi:hypothetical protein
MSLPLYDTVIILYLYSQTAGPRLLLPTLQLLQIRRVLRPRSQCRSVLDQDERNRHHHESNEA